MIKQFLSDLIEPPEHFPQHAPLPRQVARLERAIRLTWVGIGFLMAVTFIALILLFVFPEPSVRLTQALLDGTAYCIRMVATILSYVAYGIAITSDYLPPVWIATPLIFLVPFIIAFFLLLKINSFKGRIHSINDQMYN